ncbi:MAG TPA: PQQ-binding-like beta-propeller repeat protein, partial [Saprospiraceae bacterium]|nr:PQQ-binding-like beta-propeller repeat protein [Saprospiraceae bacterium]
RYITFFSLPFILTPRRLYYPTDAPLSIVFSEPLSVFSLQDQNIIITDRKGTVLPRKITFDPDTRTMLCYPAGTWPASDTLALLLTATLTDTAFNSLDGNYNGISEGEPTDNYRFTFSTGISPDQQGPQVLDADLNPSKIWAGTPILLTALFSDLSPNSTSHVRAAEYFLDQPGTAGTGKPLQPLIQWGKVEIAATVTLPTEDWATGTRSVFVHALDRFGNWGPYLELSAEVQADAPHVWPMYGQNPYHTNANAASKLAPPLKLKWTKSFPSSTSLHQPIYANGSILCSTGENSSSIAGKIHCLDTLTGAVRWSTSLGQSSAYISPVAAAYGMAYVQINGSSSSTSVSAYNIQDGSLAWSTPSYSNWSQSLGPTITKGKIYLNGGSFGGMGRFDAFTGKSDWYTYLNDYNQWTPAVFEGRAYAFLNEYLSVHRTTNGEEIWHLDLPSAYNNYLIGTAPVVDTANRIVFVTSATHFHAVHIDTRKLLWSLTGTLGKTPALQAGRLFLVRNGTLEAYEPRTGQLLWKMAGTANSLAYPPVVVGQYVFVSSSTRLYALSVADGKKVWEYAAGGALSMSDRLLMVADQATRTLRVFERVASSIPQAATEQWNMQVYPNPCNGEAHIQYTLPESAQVLLQIFDPKGQWVSTLAEGEQCAGEHIFTWMTEGLPSGFYTYRLQAADKIASGHIVVMQQ